MEIPAYYLDHLIDQGLAEDLPFGDVTTDLLAEYLGAAAGAEAVVKGKPILAAGLDVAVSGTRSQAMRRGFSNTLIPQLKSAFKSAMVNKFPPENVFSPWLGRRGRCWPVKGWP